MYRIVISHPSYNYSILFSAQDLQYEEETSRGRIYFSATFYPVLPPLFATTTTTVATTVPTTVSTDGSTPLPLKGLEEAPLVPALPPLSSNVSTNQGKNLLIDSPSVCIGPGVLIISNINVTGFSKKRELYCDLILNGNSYNRLLKAKGKKLSDNEFFWAYGIAFFALVVVLKHCDSSC